MALFRKNDFFKWAQKIKSVFCFNPHTHEGCDRSCCHHLAEVLRFNPHTYEGCDREYLRVMRPLVVSIHTPTKGVTDRERRYHDIWRVSIHTPTKGVTQDFCDYYKYLKFQSTHPRRV